MINRIGFAALVLCVAVACKHDNRKELTVSGIIKNAPINMVYLEETPLASGQRIIADSSVIGSDGSYHLKTKTADESLFSLILKNASYPFAFLVNDVPKITINADATNQHSYEVQGSAATASLKDFSIAASGKWSALYVLGQEMDSLKKTGAKDSTMITLNDKGEQQLKDLQGYVEAYIKSSSDPITSIWALGTYAQVYPVEDYQAILNSIVRKFPDNKGLAAVKAMNDRQVELAKQKLAGGQQEAEWVGKDAPELSLPDANGKEVTLSSFKGKYVLVDFWASWCLPCRRENPNVLKAYNEYKGKNFAILGVSLDKEKSDWLDAIQEDKLSWTQVSDLKEWNSVAVSTFGFNGIPFNILVDPSGKVIGQSLRGDDLEKRLQEVLQ